MTIYTAETRATSTTSFTRPKCKLQYGESSCRVITDFTNYCESDLSCTEVGRFQPKKAAHDHINCYSSAHEACASD